MKRAGRIAVVVDGNATLGMGHVYQSLTLARRILEKTEGEADLRFLTKSGGGVVDLLRASGNPVSIHQDDKSVLAALSELRPARVIFDKIDVDVDLAERISMGLGAKLIILTNLTEANRYADVTVMAGMGSAFKNLRIGGPNGQVQFWGPKYWLIRPEFFGFGAKTSGRIRNLMLIFGGADQANLSSAALGELLLMQEKFAITVVLGAAFPHRAKLEEVAQRGKELSASDVHVVDNLKDVASVMRGSDLVLTSPGLSFFEALCVGTAVLCFHQNEFQREAWLGFIPTYDRNEMARLPSLIRGREVIKPEDPTIRAMEVGTGADELITEILL